MSSDSDFTGGQDLEPGVGQLHHGTGEIGAAAGGQTCQGSGGGGLQEKGY